MELSPRKTNIFSKDGLAWNINKIVKNIQICKSPETNPNKSPNKWFTELIIGSFEIISSIPIIILSPILTTKSTTIIEIILIHIFAI